VLKPGGLFFYHTFNRSFLSKWVVEKGVEFLFKNTPKSLHVHSMFIKPSELEDMMEKSGLKNQLTQEMGPK